MKTEPVYIHSESGNMLIHTRYWSLMKGAEDERRRLTGENGFFKDRLVDNSPFRNIHCLYPRPYALEIAC